MSRHQDHPLRIHLVAPTGTRNWLGAAYCAIMLVVGCAKLERRDAVVALVAHAAALLAATLDLTPGLTWKGVGPAQRGASTSSTSSDTPTCCRSSRIVLPRPRARRGPSARAATTSAASCALAAGAVSRRDSCASCRASPRPQSSSRPTMIRGRFLQTNTNS